MNGILKLSWANIWSALVYGIFWGLLSVLVYIKEIGSILKINWIDLANIFIMAGIGFLIPIIKNLLTTDSGNFLGIIKVIPPTK